MRIGIVGSEGKKFTPETEAYARALIRDLLHTLDGQVDPTTVVVSGQCHLGGIDIWSVEEAKALGLDYKEHPPKIHAWEGGYKQRNLEIALDSDQVVCITLKVLPPTYTGMTFNLCYHCGTKDHVKSGGCWTTKQARILGKRGYTVALHPDGTREYVLPRNA